ncbi:Regulator of G-protein signaling 3 [Pseudolycoriella hygida]|uniref:Regulator of G-protein signaling 3 n=1 Tax=Pseudolycoriella hygida TaxID=35572 RepID=A0A9Q0MKG9_9DIPT|nr:Regulator of G-protein signaling 3 [Pseudolycoriella hygida]
MLKWTVNKRTDSSEPLPMLPKPKQPVTRRSLGNLHRPIRTRDGREKRRQSLGSTEMHRRINNHNKENNLVSTPHPMTMRTGSSTPYTKLDFALRDLSNLTPNITPTQNTATPSRKRNLPLSPVEQITQSKPQYASTLPTFDIEYSPCGMKAAPMIALRGLTMKDSYFENPCYFRDELPASKRLKFSPEVTPLSRRLSELRFSKMSFKRNKNMNANDDSELSSKALDDTELEQMIDAILESSRKSSLCSDRKSERRKRLNKSPTYTAADDPASDLNKFCDNFRVSPELLEGGEKTIIIQEPHVVNEREVRTPDQEATVKRKSINENSCHLRRQKAVRRKTTKSEKCVRVETKPNGKSNISPHTPLKIRHSSCIRKSIDDFAAMATPTYFGKNFECNNIHGSNSSKISDESTPFIETNDLQGSSTPTCASNTIRRCLMFSESPDSMEDSMDKRKSVASSTASRCSKSSAAMILGSLDLSIFVDAEKIHIHVIRCKDLFRQNGGSVNAYVKVSLLPAESGSENGFQRTAVQRNSSRPFFDHRFSFDRSPNDSSKRIQLAVWHRDREYKRSDFLGCVSFPIRSITSELTGSYKLQPQSCLTSPVPAVLSGDAVLTPQNSDEMITIASTINNDSFNIPLSKKGIFQRDADEHLFLRFLQLDAKDAGDESDVSKEKGRTKFTITKKLIKTTDQGYGFSIVWTHPPRIEKVEIGLPAQLGGIQPGDFVVFVDKYNVVTMPETDILNLIRSLGNSMSLEIYRRSNESVGGGGVKIRIPSMAVSGSEPMVDSITPRPLSMPCSSVSYSMEVTKRIPQVAFSKDIGHGVIV